MPLNVFRIQHASGGYHIRASHFSSHVNRGIATMRPDALSVVYVVTAKPEEVMLVMGGELELPVPRLVGFMNRNVRPLKFPVRSHLELEYFRFDAKFPEPQKGVIGCIGGTADADVNGAGMEDFHWWYSLRLGVEVVSCKNPFFNRNNSYKTASNARFQRKVRNGEKP